MIDRGDRFVLGRVAASLARVGAAVLALVGFGAGVRLLPLLLDDTVALSTSLVFAQILAVPGSQTVALVAVPTAFALAAVDLVAGGEALALVCSGVTPLRLARATLPLLLLALVLPMSITVAWGKKAQSPGPLLSAMVERATVSCGPDRPVSRVPWGVLLVLCDRGDRRVVLSGGHEAAGGLVRGRSIVIAKDVSEVALHDAQVDLPGPPRVHLATPRLVLRGGGPVALPVSLRSGARSAAVFLAVAVAAFGSFWAMITAREQRRWVALAASGGAPALFTLSMIEARGGATPWLVLVPLVAALAPLSALGWSLASVRFQKAMAIASSGRAMPAVPARPGAHDPTQSAGRDV